jgi:hypothetical protein
LSLAEHVVTQVERLQEPLGLTGWSIQCEHGPLEGAKASCSAEPEYKQATLAFDLEKFQTGDDLDETIVHEMMHMHTWAIHKVGEDLAQLAADMAPKYMREGLKAKLLEEVRQAGEDTNTQVGFTTIRLLRRLWAAEKERDDVRAELKAAKKALKVAGNVASS